MGSISVILPVYDGDEHNHLRIALESINNQTVPPDEIVIVEDGPINDRLEETLNSFASNTSIEVIRERLKTNQGLGAALRHGVEAANYKWVARMDADDICPKKRFEIQINFLEEHTEVDLVGGYLREFSEKPDGNGTVREVPTEPDKIREYAKTRSPVNHGTIMACRKEILSAGNYRPVDRMEDYDLWNRMLINGAIFENIPIVLLYARLGDFEDRRGGLEYAIGDIKRMTESAQRGFISWPRAIKNIFIRVPFRFIPNYTRRIIYDRFLRV